MWQIILKVDKKLQDDNQESKSDPLNCCMYLCSVYSFLTGVTGRKHFVLLGTCQYGMTTGALRQMNPTMEIYGSRST